MASEAAPAAPAGAVAPIPLPPPYTALPRKIAVWPLDARTYAPHPVHRPESNRIWLETNCYVDLWIEVLWAMGIDATSALAFTLAVDFEGDQWTFFKFPLSDLHRLYGVDTQELALWTAPHLHALEQVHRGRVVLMEADSYFLPDTGGTSYRREHVKSTIGIQALDLDARRLGYFHNAGYHELEGADFDGVFRLEDPWTPQSPRLLPYTEFVKADARPARSDDELTADALALGATHLRRRPPGNPFLSYKPRLASDLEWLRAQPADAFHQYAFASIRQLGACHELAGDFCAWLAGRGHPAFAAPAKELGAIATKARALQLKIARAVTARKPLDSEAFLDDMAAHWAAAMSTLDALLPPAGRK